MNKENKNEVIEVDDSVRQAEYKYTYADSSNTTLKSEKADLLVQAVEKFKAAGLDLNLQEIFIWYFEQKGVENAERFLNAGMNANVGQSSIMPSLPIPLLQAMVQNLNQQNIGAEQLLPNNEIQKLISENKEES